MYETGNEKIDYSRGMSLLMNLGKIMKGW